MKNEIPIYEIALPEYSAESQPDYKDVGGKLDRKIFECFAGNTVLLRCITVDDHPGKTLDELIRIICVLGHDRYDPTREGLHYPPEERGVDLFAGDIGRIEEDLVVMPEIIPMFYTDVTNREHTRLDLLLCYDADQLEEVVLCDWPDSCMYRFKDAKKKTQALLGIIKILR